MCPSLHVGAQQQPGGTGFAERHPNTAGVHDSRAADHTVELHVPVPADDHRRTKGVEDRAQPIFLGSMVRRLLSSVCGMLAAARTTLPWAGTFTGCENLRCSRHTVGRGRAAFRVQ